jgi:hypothetical protein
MGIAMAGTSVSTAVPTEIKKGETRGSFGISPGMASGTIISSITNFSEVAEGLGVSVHDEKEEPKSTSDNRVWQDNHETNEVDYCAEPVTLDMDSEHESETEAGSISGEKETYDIHVARERNQAETESDGSVLSKNRWVTKNNESIRGNLMQSDWELSDGYYERHKVRDSPGLIHTILLGQQKHN